MSTLSSILGFEIESEIEKRDVMIGLALEGGGSRGAYHIGVVKAYLEAGYQFDGFVGTSIGAINAAILAQGEFEKAEELWTEISTSQLFDDDITKLIEYNILRWDTSVLINANKSLKKTMDNRGWQGQHICRHRPLGRKNTSHAPMLYAYHQRWAFDS